MRRKFHGKKSDSKEAPSAPPVPGSGASIPERPLALDGARAELQQRVGANVASGYGFGDGKDRESKWRLYVFTDDPKLELPSEFQGFPVARRAVPQAGPAWGKAAGNFSRR